MSAVFINVKLALLDTCCLLNLWATQRFAEIIQGFQFPFAIVERVHEETKSIDIQSVLDKGLLSILQPNTEKEWGTYIDIVASGLHDGEAMTYALGLYRNALIATDEKKARKIIMNISPKMKICTTSDLIKAWAKKTHIKQSELKQVLKNIEQYGHYKPGGKDPQFLWWQSVLH